MDYNDILSKLYAVLVNGQVNSPEEGGIFGNRVKDFQNIIQNTATNQLNPVQTYNMVENTPSLNAILKANPVINGKEPLSNLLNEISQGSQALAQNPIDMNLGINSLNKTMNSPELQSIPSGWMHDPNPDYIVRSPGDDLISNKLDFAPITDSVKKAIHSGIGNAVNDGTAKNQKLIEFFNKLNLK